jgi:hypothetical protein
LESGIVVLFERRGRVVVDQNAEGKLAAIHRSANPSREEGPADEGYCNRASDRPTGDLVPMMLLSESAERKSNLNLLLLRPAIGRKSQEMPRSVTP